MKSSDLTPNDRSQIYTWLIRRADALAECRQKMDARCWDPTDRLYLAIVSAEELLRSSAIPLSSSLINSPQVTYKSLPTDPPPKQYKKKRRSRRGGGL